MRRGTVILVFTVLRVLFAMASRNNACDDLEEGDACHPTNDKKVCMYNKGCIMDKGKGTVNGNPSRCKLRCTAVVPVMCEIPVISDSHVVLDMFVGELVVGTEITYTCIPCTYFPPIDAGMIVCQADGTWSLPTCLYGPDVGHTFNGVSIPNDAIGCMSAMNTTCAGDDSSIENGFRYDGTLLNGTEYCYCDQICCDYGDCCFDHTCM